MTWQSLVVEAIKREVPKEEIMKLAGSPRGNAD